MAIPVTDQQDSESESEGVLPRKASYSQLLLNYLHMGLLSCFGIGPTQKPHVAPSTSMHSDKRQLSLPREVPQDDLKEEPYAHTVESYGPDNSVSKSFKAGFLGSDFNNEFSLTNGEGWKVWQRPGELTPEAVAQLGGNFGPVRMDSPAEGPASPSLSDAIGTGDSECTAAPDSSPQGDANSASFALPCGQDCEGWGQEETRGQKVQECTRSQSGPGVESRVEASSPQNDGASRKEELDTLGGAALLAKLGTPYTIPLTPEIEEELQRSESFKLRNPSLLTRELSAASSSEAEAAGFSSEVSAANRTPSTQMDKDTSRWLDAASQSQHVFPHKPVSSLGLVKLPNGSHYQLTLEQSGAPRRTQSLRSAGSFKQVKETHQIMEGEDEEGNKTVNQYVKLRRLGTGSYGKVVLHKDSNSGKLYAMKILHRSRLMHVHVVGEETAWTDVLREIAIMKMLDHPNLVSLEEVIDDPDNDKMYMVLEYEEKGPVFEGTGPAGGIGEESARAYIRDTVAGLQYLHYHNIVHGDIKPDNLMVSAEGRIKIGDFGVSHMFETDNDQLRRTPGTPAFTAPECCLGAPYHGKPADVWALGCTLYVFVTGQYPFMTNSHALGDLYHAILHQEVAIPASLSPDLQDLLRKLLEKDPQKRITVEEAASHPWLVKGLGPLPQVELKAIDVDSVNVGDALTKLDDASKARLAQLIARHAAAVRRRKAGGSDQGTSDLEGNVTLSRESSLNAYDSDFSAPSSQPESPKREAKSAASPIRTSSRLGL